MNNNEDNNSPVINKFTTIQSNPEPFAQPAQLSLSTLSCIWF